MKSIYYSFLLILIFSCNSIDKSNSVEDEPITSTDKTSTQNDLSSSSISISVSNFKKSVYGKSMQEVKDLYGPPCQAQELNGMKIWYYGKNVCGESRSIRIINEDTNIEVDMVQLAFSNKIVSTINIY